MFTEPLVLLLSFLRSSSFPFSSFLSFLHIPFSFSLLFVSCCLFSSHLFHFLLFSSQLFPFNPLLIFPSVLFLFVSFSVFVSFPVFIFLSSFQFHFSFLVLFVLFFVLFSILMSIILQKNQSINKISEYFLSL